MPLEGLAWLPKPEILTFEEIIRFVRIMMGLGVKTVRLTGGEPTVRESVEELVAGLAQLSHGLDLSMTTNGFLLPKKAAALARAGLKRINISLDTLRPDRFKQIVRVKGIEVGHVLDGMAAAEAAGMHPIKVNMVVMRGQNDDEVVEMAALGREKGYQVRYIEFMPLDGERGWSRMMVFPAREILDRINRVFPLLPANGRDHEPATRYRFADGRGEVGVIASVTEPFCGSCNRIRLTADGQIRTCLFSLKEHNLKRFLRSGATDEEIAGFVQEAVWQKEPGHRINEVDFVQPARTMAAIGG
jgi:cyclic pyranopterin phosphate synthase